MVYSSDSAKWRAYQFSDPFAAGSFYVCNKINKYFCRPDCDAHPLTELRSEIKFVPSVNDAVDLGYVPCDSCDPLSVPPIDVDLLVSTVREINTSIGFVPPAMDDDLTEEIPRRLSVPLIGYPKYSGYERETSNAVLKNDNEHFRLVDLACRHLALAAASSVFSTGASPKDESPDYLGKKSRKRRGGVLGFKELAAKSKLSAWHFHRVFKSVTGLTPKTYGDKCYELLQAKRDEHHKHLLVSLADSLDSPHSLAPIAQMNSNEHLSKYSSPASLVESLAGSLVLPISGQKRGRTEDKYVPKKAKVATPGFASFEYGNFEEDIPSFDFELRASLAPDLTAFNSRPQLLFSHVKPVEFATDFGLGAHALPLQMNVNAHPVSMHAMMDMPMDELLGNFADLFAGGEELLPVQHELDLTDNMNFGLLPELLTTNAGF